MTRVAVVGGTNCLTDKLCLVSIYDDYDVLLFSYMPVKMLGECALGINEAVCTAFCRNKPVYVLKDGLQYKKICDEVVYQMYCTYAQRLKYLGVKFINSTEEIKI